MSDWKCKCGHTASAHHVRTCLGDQFCACREFQGVPNPPATPTVPRVASSLDDLRVGMVVATRDVAFGRWSIHTYTSEWKDEGGPWNFEGGRVVILSDPPPELVSVSRAAIDRLAEAIDAYEQGQSSLAWVCTEARSLLAEVRAQEPTP